MSRSIMLAAVVAVALAAAGGVRAEESPTDMPDFPGRDETFGYCIGCHSMKVVGRQGMDRERWDTTLSWMSEKHNMPAPDGETRKLLLDYLEKAYPAAAPAQGGGFVVPFAPQR